MAEIRKLVELGMAPELARAIVQLIGASSGDYEARIAALEAFMQDAIVADEAP